MSRKENSFSSSDTQFERIPLPGDTDSFYPSLHDSVVTSDAKGIQTTVACHGSEFPVGFISGSERQRQPDDLDK
jgi:hypothetical protein